MANIIQALDRALRARYPVQEVRTPVTQRRGLTARMNQLEKLFTRKGDRPGAAGRRAAKEAGISLRTWQRWRKGEQKPTAATLRKLEKAHQNLVQLPKLKRTVNRAPVPDKVDVSAAVVWNGYKNQVPQRSVKFRHQVRPVMVATIRAWARQGPEAAAKAFQDGLAIAEGVPLPPGIQFEGTNVEIHFP